MSFIHTHNGLRSSGPILSHHYINRTYFVLLAQLQKQFFPVYKTVKSKLVFFRTETEVHAELCYAEVLLLKAVLTLCEDETLVSFVKAGLKVRTCYQSFRYTVVVSCVLRGQQQ